MKDDIALNGLLHERELPKVNAARPIFRNREFGERLPCALTNPFHPHQRRRLRNTFEGAKSTCAGRRSTVITAPVDIDGERSRGSVLTMKPIFSPAYTLTSET